MSQSAVSAHSTSCRNPRGRDRVLLETRGGNDTMPLPHNALVLVADGRKMLFFRNHGDEQQIDLRTEAHEARKDRKDRDIKTDAPGTTAVRASSGGGDVF